MYSSPSKVGAASWLSPVFVTPDFIVALIYIFFGIFNMIIEQNHHKNKFQIFYRNFWC